MELSADDAMDEEMWEGAREPRDEEEEEEEPMSTRIRVDFDVLVSKSTVNTSTSTVSASTSTARVSNSTLPTDQLRTFYTRTRHSDDPTRPSLPPNSAPRGSEFDTFLAELGDAARRLRLSESRVGDAPDVEFGHDARQTRQPETDFAPPTWGVGGMYPRTPMYRTFLLLSSLFPSRI